MSYTDNPIADFHDWDDRQSKELAKLPVCSECDHHIQDEHCYEINGELICSECLENNHRKRTEDYVC
jgi:formylmethanofuran dehydrogenase subunit E